MLGEVMQNACSIAGHGSAADVTGMRRVCTDLMSRIDDFVCRVDAIRNSVADTRECFQFIEKVIHIFVVVVV